MDSARLSLISLPSWLCLWGVLFRLLLLHLQPTVAPASLLHVISDLFLSPVVCRWCLFFLSEHIATPPVQNSCHKKMLQMHEQCYFWLALFTSFVGFVCFTYILLSRWAWRWPPTWKTAWTATSSTCSALFDRSAARTSGPSWCCRGWRCPSTWHSTHLPSAGSCSVSRTELQRYLLRLYWKSGAQWQRRRGTKWCFCF